jgi:hypothetical protein
LKTHQTPSSTKSFGLNCIPHYPMNTTLQSKSLKAPRILCILS